MALSHSVSTWSIDLQSFFALGYLLTVIGCFVTLHAVNPHRISWALWFLAVLPTLVLTTYVYAHSLFVNHIDWGAKRYYCGAKGVVKRIEMVP